MNENKIRYNGPGILNEDGIPKHNGTYDAFETISSLMIESYYSHTLFTEVDDILYIGNEATLLKKDPIVVNGCTEDVVVVAFNLEAHPNFVSELTELLVRACVNYTLGECFSLDSDGQFLLESEVAFATEKD